MSDDTRRSGSGRRADAGSKEGAVASGELSGEGRPFGRYRLLKRLSYGGMGEIFLAKHDGIGGFSKLLVIKRLLPHYQGDADVVAMFFDEAKLQALMSDRHIVQIWDMGQVDEQYFIAMEYVEGTSWRRLGERLHEHGAALHAAHAVDLVVQACRGLGYAHNLAGPDGEPLSLVHRDVNPQNVLVSFAGEVKLIDFGIAKSELSGHHTETGTIKGKFAYMSPEQARAEPLDRRSDIFSMGICLYELLTGKNPFQRKNVVLALEAICEHQPPPLEQLRPDAAALAPVVERCLAKDPDERFADCAEIEEALLSLYHDGLCGEPEEPLVDLLARLFRGDIDQQSAFLRRHGFASAMTQRGGSEPGARSPLMLPGDSTRRMSLRRGRSDSQTASRERSLEGERPTVDTQPTATLALASLPSLAVARSQASSEEVSLSKGPPAPVPPVELPPPAPRAAGSRRVAIAASLSVALLLVLVGVTILASPDEEPQDETLGVVVAQAVAQEPVVDEPVVKEPLVDEPVADEPVVDEPVADEPVVDEPVVEEPVVDEPVVDEPVVEATKRAAPGPRATRRRPARERRTQPRPAPVVVEPPAAAEKAAVPAGVLTVNAGGPFSIRGKGVRARNVAKVSLLAGESSALTISGGPVEVRLRVSASPSGATVRVDTDPWTIVRANNLGKGRTPQAVRVEQGASVQLILKHPDAGEMKVTLGFSG